MPVLRTEAIVANEATRSMPILEKEVSEYPAGLLEQPLDTDERRWYAVYTKARQEKALARQLVGYDIPFYLPLVPKENYIRGKRVESHLPIFGGYIFLFSSEDERVQALTTNRISQVLPVNDQQQIRHDLLQLREVIEAGVPVTLEKQLQSGDRVRVEKGPLRGVEGTVVARRGERRLIVAVNYLQQGVSVQIDDFMVTKI